MGWVGLDRVGLSRDFSVFGMLGWVGSSIADVLTFERISLTHLRFGSTKQLKLVLLPI